MGWVTERSKCTLEVAFNNIHDFAKKDVDEANSLRGIRGDEPFSVVPGDGGTVKRFFVTGFSMNRPDGDERTIKFELQNDHILIDRSGSATLLELSNIVVKQRWVFSKSACLLCVDGELKSAEEISQIALEPMFFG